MIFFTLKDGDFSNMLSEVYHICRFHKIGLWQSYTHEELVPFTVTIHGVIHQRMFTVALLKQVRKCSCGFVWHRVVGSFADSSEGQFLREASFL